MPDFFLFIFASKLFIMKRLVSGLMFLFTSFAFIYAQAPQMFNYQAVVRDAGGNVIANTPVDINILIRDGSPVGAVVFDETHFPTTNDFGLVNLQIGSIETVQFSGIDWSGDIKFIELVVNGISVGTQQLLSVPYALHSKTSEDAFSGLYNDLLNTPDFTGWDQNAADDFSGSYIDLFGVPTELSAFSNDMGYITSPNDADADPANELQTLSISGSNLSISGGNTVAIPASSYSSGSGISISGNTITNTAPDQTVTVTGSGATTVTGTYPSFTISSTDNVNDADANPTNEIQTLSLANNTLSLTGGGNVSLSGYVDTLWRQQGTKIYNTNTGNVGIGTNTPPAKLVVQGDATLLDTDPLFEVKDRDGHTVFIIYPDSARLYVGDDGSKTNKGAFAVSGRNTAKLPTHDFLWVTPDSTRIFTGDDEAGFGVENIETTGTQRYMKLTPENYFIGHESGSSITTGMYNSFLGYRAGSNNAIGGNNVFLGYNAGFNNNASYNVFIGFESGYLNSTGSHNTFLGFKAGYNNTIGFSNVYIGNSCGLNSSSGSGNVALGNEAALSINSGTQSVYVGYGAGQNIASGTGNVFLGYNVGAGGTIGANSANNNVLVGNRAGYHNQAGEYNIAIGYRAGYGVSTVSSYNSNTFIGTFSGQNTTSGVNNVCLGNYSGSGITSGNANVFIGPGTGSDNNGSSNIALGNSAGASMAGNLNIAIGQSSGRLVTGTHNICLGNNSGYNASGSWNIFIGSSAGYNETGSDKLYIDNTSTSTPLIKGDFATNKVTLNDVLILTPRATAPTLPVEGEMYVNSTDYHVYCYLNGVWVRLD